MNNSLPTADLEETIEQLVDGELRGQRYGDAIRAIDKAEDGWRRCALAFLQEQALKQEMLKLVQSGWSKPVSVDAAMLQPSSSSRSSASVTSGTSSLRAIANRINGLALAASILLAFGMGWFGAVLRIGDSTISGRGTIGIDGQGAGYVGSSSQGGGMWGDAITYDPSRFVVDQEPQFVQLDNRIPESLRSLEQDGMVRLETTSGVLSIQLEDGRPAIMPIQEIHMQPVLYAY